MRIFTILLMLIMTMAQAQTKLELYPEGVLNQRADVDNEDNNPEFYAYLPTAEARDIAFLIIPGGGYARVAMQHEGHDVAKRLQELGYAAFVLRYRLPDDQQQFDKTIAPIQDAQTALSYMRKHLPEMGFEEVKYIGTMGFSAGGHLAATLSTHFGTDYRSGEVSGQNLRPDFSVLVYPVISMDDEIAHRGSKTNLLGANASPHEVVRFSNEKQVNAMTPPAFLVHAADDKVVPIAHSERYLRALDANQVAGDLFRYDTGGHGFGLKNKTDSRDWLAAMLIWVDEVWNTQ